MLGSLVAWVALAGGLNYENAGASARRVVEDLARVSGTRMEAIADFERDIVAVRWRDKPLEAIRAELAERLAGEWEREGEILRLVRSREALRKEADAERETLQKLFQEELRKQGGFADLDRKPDEAEYTTLEQTLRALAVAEPRDIEWSQRIRQVARRGPVDRLLLRILALLGPRIVGDVPVAEGRVYALAPNARQLKLPDAVRKDVDACLEEWRLWHRVAGTATPTGSYIATDPRYLPEPPARVTPWLVVMRFESGASYSFDLLLADDQGVVTARADFHFSLPQREYWSVRPSEPLPTGKTPLAIGDDAKRMGRLFALGNTESPLRQEQALRSIVLEPEVHDPLAATTGVALLAAAHALDRDLFAVMPDGLAEILPIWSKTDAPTAEAVFAAAEGVSCQVETTDTQLVVRPRMPQLARSQRVSRPALGTLLRGLNQTGRIEPTALAEYAQKSGTMLTDPLVKMCANALATGAGGAVAVWDWPALAVLGAIQNRSWATGNAQVEVPIGGSEFLLDRVDHLFVRSVRRYQDAGFRDGLDLLPCLSYPQRLGANTLLSLRASTEQGLLAGYDGLPYAYPHGESLIPEMIAKKGTTEEMYYGWTTFRLGVVLNVGLNLGQAWRKPGTFGSQLQFFQGDFRQPQMAWDDLPANRMREWEKQAAMLRKALDDALASRKPPPPPQH